MAETPKKEIIKRFPQKNVDTGKFAGVREIKVSVDQPPPIDELPPIGTEEAEKKPKEGESDILPGVNLKKVEEKFKNAKSPMRGAQDD